MKLVVGGPKSFMRLFVEEAKSQGISITHNRFAAAKIALIPISMCPKALRKWKAKRGYRRVVQRLDGVFYDPQKSDFDESLSGDLKELYHHLSDVFIFQSNYSRLQCEHFLGVSESKCESHNVLNGTDLDLFYPAKNIHSIQGGILKLITTGNFRDPEMLLPILDALDRFEWKLGFELEVVGPVAGSILPQVESRKYVNVAGVCSREEVAEKLRNAHLYLFSFLNPNCPNAVIEATASGLPVVGFDSGAMNELCDFNGELLATIETEHSVIHKRSELLAGSEALLQKLIHCVEHYEYFRQRVLKARSHFSISDSVESYLKIIRPFL